MHHLSLGYKLDTTNFHLCSISHHKSLPNNNHQPLHSIKISINAKTSYDLFHGLLTNVRLFKIFTKKYLLPCFCLAWTSPVPISLQTEEKKGT